MHKEFQAKLYVNSEGIKVCGVFEEELRKASHIFQVLISASLA